MGIWQRLKAAVYGPSESVGQHDSWLVRAIGGGKTKAGVQVSEWTALQLPVVYAAVGIIADTLAQLPLNLLRKTAKGSEVADDLPLYQVLHDQPNEHMSSFVWRNTTQHHVLLWGNGYAEIEQNNAGEAVGLWPLLPDRTRPRKNDAGDLLFRTSIDGVQYELPADRVLHIPAMGFDGYIGYSPVSLARQAIGLGLAMEEFGAKFFANDAKSGGFLLHPGRLSTQAQANLGAGDKEKDGSPRGALERQGGLENAHRVKVLEEGMKFVPTTIPPEDAQFLGSREMQIAEIARLYRVPLILLNSHEKSTSWGSGIEQLMIGFVVWTIQPWLVRWEQELNRKLFTEAQREAGYFVKFNHNALLRGDMAARSQFYESGIRSRWLLPNEVREKEDLNRIEGGDEPPPLQGVAPQPPQPAAPAANPNSEDGQ